MEKYYNDAIIGNKEITASYTKKGELLRVFYPNNKYIKHKNIKYIF